MENGKTRSLSESKVGITSKSKRCLILRVLKKEPREIIRKESYLSDIWGYSSAGRAPALQAGGQRFDPVYLHQCSEKNTKKAKSQDLKLQIPMGL